MVLDEHDFGLDCWSGSSQLMPRPHRHDDIEVNVVQMGELEYMFGGRTMRVGEGSVALFWAAIPHQLVGGEPTVAFWLTIPLDVAMTRRLPESLVGPLLRGQLVSTDIDATVLGHFVQWERDMRGQASELQVASLLEIEAWLRRLAYEMEQGRARPVGHGHSQRLARVAAMADCIGRRYSEPIQVSDIAAEARINKQYAMVLFRETVGMTIGEYLTGRRVAEARRLLLTTDEQVSRVGFAAGFGSESQFYAAFRAATGESPAAYRTRHAGLADAPPCPDGPRAPLHRVLARSDEPVTMLRRRP